MCKLTATSWLKENSAIGSEPSVACIRLKKCYYNFINKINHMKGLRWTKNALFSFLPINFLFRWLDSSSDWKPSGEEKTTTTATKNEIKQSKHCSLLFIVNDSSSTKYKLTLRKGHLVVQLYLTFSLFLSLFRVFSTRFSFIRSLTSENSLHLDTRSTWKSLRCAIFLVLQE